MTLGKKIKERRIELGMSQDELAQKLGYTHRSTISRIERDLTNPPLTKLIAYAEALDMPPEELIDCVDDDALVADSNIHNNSQTAKFQNSMYDRYHALFDLVKDATPEEMDQIEQIVKVIVKGNKKDD